MAPPQSSSTSSGSAKPQRIKFGNNVLKPRPPYLKLTGLPVEIKSMIFSRLHAVDQTCLGLACKDLANVLATVNLNLDGNVWWAWDKIKLMRRLKDWIGPKYRFCGRCLKYRPRAREFLHGMAVSLHKDCRIDFVSAAVRNWEAGIGNCPGCKSLDRTRKLIGPL